ncbi:hypothetical protein KIN20_026354 [Parelaphostrongylus tenuis]|uniref:Uncharacterized protein n=1 Tax=Parelaphostrongylus tenuis TaxID=148309 RepID=A0AAD5WCZ4_PARTN|nr:hypothetical protein KIN20_026354 [Parelaphostrongylus tenuis]
MDEEEFNAARQRKPSIPERECSMMSDVFDEEWMESELEQQPVKDEDALLRQFAANLHRIEKMLNDVIVVSFSFLIKKISKLYVK